jgi:5-methylcytosine-specific restriction protein A
MKKKKCNHPGCGNLIDMDKRYCPKHIYEQPVSKKIFSNAERLNAGLYNTYKWRKLRNSILKQYPYCSKCGIGKNETSLQVHHIIPPRGNEELFFNEQNLVSICPRCHILATGREIAERERRKRR